MVNQKKTLSRLNKEKDYEERLSKNLSNYFLDCLPEIKDLDDKQKKEIEKGIKMVMHESIKHEHMINRLIQMIMENGENKY